MIGSKNSSKAYLLSSSRLAPSAELLMIAVRNRGRNDAANAMSSASSSPQYQSQTSARNSCRWPGDRPRQLALRSAHSDSLIWPVSDSAPGSMAASAATKFSGDIPRRSRHAALSTVS